MQGRQENMFWTNHQFIIIYKIFPSQLCFSTLGSGLHSKIDSQTPPAWGL